MGHFADDGYLMRRSGKRFELEVKLSNNEKGLHERGEGSIIKKKVRPILANRAWRKRIEKKE